MGRPFCGLDGLKRALGYNSAFLGSLTNNYPATSLPPSSEGSLWLTWVSLTIHQLSNELLISRAHLCTAATCSHCEVVKPCILEEDGKPSDGEGLGKRGGNKSTPDQLGGKSPKGASLKGSSPGSGSACLVGTGQSHQSLRGKTVVLLAHGPAEEMLVTGNEFNTRNITNKEILLVAKMSRRAINVNLGKLGEEKGKMRIRGPSLAKEGGPALSLTFSCLVPMRR